MKYKRVWTLTWLVMVLAFIALSLMPKVSVPSTHNFDKVVHFFGYFVLTMASFYLLKLMNRVIVAILILLLVSVATELIQMYIPERSASYGDAAANISGIAVGAVIGSLLLKIRKNIPLK